MTTQHAGNGTASVLRAGQASLGIELGSTRIKAVLIGPDHAVLATGSHAWENQFVEGRWTYDLAEVWSGLQAATAAVLADAETRHGIRPTAFAGIGVSAMMHGYLAFDAAGDLLVPFRTWRNTSTGQAAAELSELFGYTIPLRWTIAHLRQAMLDGEAHVPEIAHVTTLAGYVHWQLTGEKVLGVGDASGVLPVDPATRTYDARMVAQFDDLAADQLPAGTGLLDLLPSVQVAGEVAGRLTDTGAALLDPSGTLGAGIPLCPPEGDAGTGMVATNAVAQRTGNVSVGTSIFAMVVLEGPLARMHPEIDLVTTPAGDLVAMVHCNNGASELGEWAGLFHAFARALGAEASADDVFRVLLTQALEGAPDGGGLLAYNYLSGEPVTHLEAGRPLVVRTPDSDFSLATFMRTQVYGVFATLSLGMQLLHAEGVGVDSLVAHGGLFRTEGVAQRFLAAAVDAPIAVTEAADEGGAWGIAVLAQFTADTVAGGSSAPTLHEYLTDRVFAGAATTVVQPVPDDVAGYAAYLERYQAGLAVEQAAVTAL